MVMNAYCTWPSIRKPIRAFVAGVNARESSPNTRHCPPVGVRNPFRMLIVVVFPVPFLPSSPKMLPRRTLKFMFSKIRRLP